MTLLLSTGTRTPPDGNGVLSSDESAIVRDLSIVSLGDTTGDSSLQPFDPAILGPSLDELVYDQALSGIGPDLISFLVNASTNVVIFGVDSASVSSLGGPTGLGDTSLQADGSILVIYDTTSCGGNGAHVFDIHNVAIPDPPFIILAHELAHAKNFIDGTINANTPESVAEQLAIVVENQIRQEAQPYYQQITLSSIDLSQRDPNNHGGGCNAASPNPLPGSDPWKINCFIASAAYQSEYAQKVEWLRQFRDRRLRSTKLGCRFFDAFYNEYYQYSPAVARDMAQSSALRAAVRTIIVEPFIEFLWIFELYLTNGENSTAFMGWVDKVLARKQSSRNLFEAKTLLGEIERMRLMLERSAEEQSGTRNECPENVSVADLIRYLEASVLTHCKTTNYTVWVLAEPLKMHWSAVLARATGRDAADVGASYLRSIEEWFSRLPLPSDFTQMSRKEVAEELSHLQHIIFRGVNVRRCFGQHLCNEFGGRTCYDIRRLLQEVWF